MVIAPVGSLLYRAAHIPTPTALLDPHNLPPACHPGLYVLVVPPSDPTTTHPVPPGHNTYPMPVQGSPAGTYALPAGSYTAPTGTGHIAFTGGTYTTPGDSQNIVVASNGTSTGC